MNIDEKGLKKNAFKRLKYKKKYRKGPAPRDGWDTPHNQDPYTPEEVLGEELPLQYYDNQDGFWSSYIKKKEEYYSKTEVINYRPYFKH